MRLRNWLFGHFEEVSRLFGFEMVEGPVLESEELFTRKAGEEITDQLYNFQVRGIQQSKTNQHRRFVTKSRPSSSQGHCARLEAWFGLHSYPCGLQLHAIAGW